ncbi:MAG TPA: glycoside hydrolase family 2 TIM barrel-domain containing protein, partial [Bacteroidales bacterium]|nr:glycoside hydrolase family 2 TIM barrel-domain containing protein [Bacteroidales bacterium]
QQQSISTSWENIIPWNPENPQLYVITIKLKNARKQLIHEWTSRVGFRTVEFRPKDGIYVNGTRIIMKGINRHSFYPDGGRTTNREISLKDALLIKEMNMNAVRCHYPPDDHFLDMCDSLGLFMVDELAGWQNSYDTPTGLKLQKEMLLRDVNHPCIVLWSNGNEGGWNYELDKHFADYDPQKRHVIHPWADFDGLDTHHYPAFLTGVARFTNGYKVFMPTEFMHGMYDQGHGAGLEDFWNNYTSHPLFAGGFMWDFSDNAVKRSDKNGILDTENFNAPDGILGPYREKEGSYYTVREVWAPVQFKKMYITSSFKGDFTITNNYLFTNLNQCRMEYRLYSTPAPLNGGQQRETGNGTVVLPELAPGETGKAHMQLPATFFDADILELEAFDKYGKSICTWTWPIHYAGDYLAMQNTSSSGGGRASISELDSLAALKGENVTVLFSKKTGKITQVRNGDRVIPFGNGPIAVGMKIRFDNYRLHMDGNDALFVARYLGGVDSIVWRMKPSGLLQMDALMLNRADGGGGFDDAFMDEAVLNFGITFSFPEENVSGMTWLGRGPYRVWKNRIKGTNYGIWHKDYNNTITGESLYGLVYPEFKGYHANLYWATLESGTTPFTVYSGSDGVFFRVFTPQEPAGRQDGKNTMPDFPEGDISFLYDIPAIRCFKPVSQHGPQSQPGNIRIKKGDEGISMRLMFDFREK